MASLFKNILIFIILAGVLYAGYYVFSVNKEAELAVDGGVSEGELLATEFLMRLSEIQDINLSRDFFDDSRFRSLVSFNTNPESVSAGRPNPFSQ